VVCQWEASAEACQWEDMAVDCQWEASAAACQWEASAADSAEVMARVAVWLPMEAASVVVSAVASAEVSQLDVHHLADLWAVLHPWPWHVHSEPSVLP